MSEVAPRAMRWLLLMLLVGTAVVAHAALAVGDRGVVLRDSGELYFFIDKSHALTIDNALAAAQPWQRVTPQTHLSRYDTSTLWLHLRIAAGAVDRQLVLYQVVPRRIELRVYTQLAHGADRAAPDIVQPLRYPHYLFPIDVPAGATMDVYLQARGNMAEALNDLQLWPMRALLATLPKYSAIEWANIAIMALVASTSFIMWLFVRQRLLLLFAVLVSAQWLVYVAGHAYSMVWWSTTPAFSARCYELTTPISTLIGIAFTRAFLDLPRYAPRLNRIAELAMIALAIVAAAMLLSSRSYDLYALPIVPLNWAFLVGVSFYLYRRTSNRGHALVMLVCWLIWVCVLVAFMLATLLGSEHMLLRYVSDVSMQLRTVLFVICLGYHYQQTVRGEERARSDAQAKSEFLARMSHEIRTPMNGILGMSELLRDSGLNNTQRRYNDIVNSSANALLTVINDILDFSKIQAGRMRIEHIAFDLHRVAAETLTFFRMKADEKDLELLCDIRPDVPAWVVGDPLRIRQILINFLSNALKFTAAGEIRLQLKKRDQFIAISVQDTGPGIAKDVQAQLFESFTQADTSIARQHGGTGLGLAICAQLAELMGGQVGVHSQPGRGSTFWVDLPLPATVPQEPPHRPADLRGRSILVVDDNAHFCELVVECAKDWQADLQVAYSGAEALAKIRDYRAHKRSFDMISIDLKMPGMNGLEFARALRDEYGESLPPLLLLTIAADIPQSVVRRAAGIEMVQEKPVIPCDLREIFARVLGISTASAPVETRAEKIAPMHSALTLLVVEDNLTNQVVIQSMLETLGHDCRLVANGKEAIAAYREHHREFDLMLMDCEMPGMDGYEATRQIRAYERERDLAPKIIVALTAHTLEEHIAACRAAGMDAHLAKPLSLERLRDFLAGVSEGIASGGPSANA